MTVTVHHGDSRQVLDTFPDATFDACVTDPPYALVSIVQRFGGEDAAPVTGNDAYSRASRGFMGQSWDTGETAFSPDFWRQVYDKLKPGGHVLAFSGTRTYHRLACAIEDAGFEVRDMVAWLYGTGFPKSHDMALAFESRLCERRTGEDELAGWFYMDTGEPIRREPPYRHPEANEWAGWGTALKPGLEPMVLARKPFPVSVADNLSAHGVGGLNIDACRVDAPEGVPAFSKANQRPGVTFDVGSARTGENTGRGRWPANVVHDGSPEVLAAFPDTAPAVKADKGTRTAMLSDRLIPAGGVRGHEDAGGSAARFFYSAKATADDRLGSEHPTVKRVDLMRWCLRLVVPAGARVLDPFAGSGTTGLAAMRESMDCDLIEREAQYVADIRAKLAHVAGEDCPLFAPAVVS